MYPDIDFLVLRSSSQLKSEYFSNLSHSPVEMKAYFQTYKRLTNQIITDEEKVTVTAGYLKDAVKI